VNANESLEIRDSTFKSYYNSVYTSGKQLIVSGVDMRGENKIPVNSIPNKVDGGGFYITDTF